MDEKVFSITIKLNKGHLIVTSYAAAIAFGAFLHWLFANPAIQKW